MNITQIKTTQKNNAALLLAGLIIAFIGLAHTIMPSLGYSSDVKEFFAAQKEIDNHFYFLATYAICSFLLFIGTVTIYISTIKVYKIQFYFSLFSIVLWLSRLILEILYPVKLSLFGLASPTLNLIIVFIIIISLLGYSTIKSYKQIRK